MEVLYKLNYLFFFFFLNGCTCDIWKFLGGGWTPTHSCNLYLSYGNTVSFNLLYPQGQGASAVTAVTHCTTAGTSWAAILNIMSNDKSKYGYHPLAILSRGRRDEYK